MRLIRFSVQNNSSRIIYWDKKKSQNNQKNSIFLLLFFFRISKIEHIQNFITKWLFDKVKNNDEIHKDQTKRRFYDFKRAFYSLILF